MPFVAPKSAATNSTAGGVNRTTFRPPWVKDDGTASPLKSTVKTTVPWAKKTTTTTAAASDKDKETVPKANIKKPAVSKTSEPVKKTTAPILKKTEPIVNKQPVAAVKKFAPTAKETAKKVVSSSSSSEEEETEEEETEEEETEEEETEEEESEEESEEEVKAPPVAVNKKSTTPAAPKKPLAQKTSELEQRFTLEKPKLRPVVVKRDKSMKKIEDDDEKVEGETEEERERRLRFKLEKPKLRHVKREEKPLPSKSSENILKIRPVLKKVNKIDEIIKETKEEPKPEFKTKTLRKTPSIKRDPSAKNGELCRSVLALPPAAKQKSALPSNSFLSIQNAA